VVGVAWLTGIFAGSTALAASMTGTITSAGDGKDDDDLLPRSGTRAMLGKVKGGGSRAYL